ncbi:MAG: glutathione peroxidase [Bacteroidia bacterium]
MFLLLASLMTSPQLLSAQHMDQSVYQYTVKDISGHDVSLADYRGKALLIVNVASECGYTPQYTDLQALYESHGEKGLAILGFPCNQFAGQEPGSDAEIMNFCSTKFHVTFPMFSKIDVKGKDQVELYKFLTHKDLNGVDDSEVKWNFQKYLISREGKLLHMFKPGEKVDDPEVLKVIEAALN